MTGPRATASVRDRLESTLGSKRLPDAIGQRGAQLLARLNSPVSVVAIGLPGSGKSSIVNMLLGRPVLPDRGDLPVIEIVAGAVPRTVFQAGDGCRRAVAGVALDAAVPADTAMIRLELPVPVLEIASLAEIRIAGTAAEQRAAVDLAVRRADIVLWCTQGFSTVERDLWSAVPDALKDHSFLVLTKADRLLMQGCLPERIAALRDMVAEEFHSLYPVATLQAIAARSAAGGEASPLWKASGGRALATGVMKQVETGRAADADSALLFLNRFGDRAAGETGALAPPPMPAAAGAPDAAGATGRALDYLAGRAGEMLRAMPDDGNAAQSFVLDHCLATATELAGILAPDAPQGAPDSGVGCGIAEGMDLMLLLQLEQTGEAAEDALALLLQLRKEMAEHVAALAG